MSTIFSTHKTICTMKKLLLVAIAAIGLSVAGCDKDKDENKDPFLYGTENLIGTWDGIAIKTDGGSWLEIPQGSPASFSATFNSDGTYSGEGQYGNGSGTYKASGNMIYTYIDNEEYARYEVSSFQDGVAEMTMTVIGTDESFEIRVKKR